MHNHIHQIISFKTPKAITLFLLLLFSPLYSLCSVIYLDKILTAVWKPFTNKKFTNFTTSIAVSIE